MKVSGRNAMFYFRTRIIVLLQLQYSSDEHPVNGMFKFICGTTNTRRYRRRSKHKYSRRKCNDSISLGIFHAKLLCFCFTRFDKKKADCT